MQCCQLCFFCNQLREKSRAGDTEKRMSDYSIATRLAGKISQKDQGTGQRPTNVLLLTSLDEQFVFLLMNKIQYSEKPLRGIQFEK